MITVTRTKTDAIKRSRFAALLRELVDVIRKATTSAVFGGIPPASFNRAVSTYSAESTLLLLCSSSGKMGASLRGRGN